MRLITRFAETRTTKFDFFMCLLRIYLVYYLIANYGLLQGILIYAAIVVGLDFAIVKSLGLEALNATDTNMWYDQETNRCNVMAALIFDKCDESKIRDVF